ARERQKRSPASTGRAGDEWEYSPGIAQHLATRPLAPPAQNHPSSSREARQSLTYVATRHSAPGAKHAPREPDSCAAPACPHRAKTPGATDNAAEYSPVQLGLPPAGNAPAPPHEPHAPSHPAASVPA